VYVGVAVEVRVGVKVNLGVLVGLGVLIGFDVFVGLGVLLGLGAACTAAGLPPKNENRIRKMIVSRLVLNRNVFMGLLGYGV
jgi:hypothetical protein